MLEFLKKYARSLVAVVAAAVGAVVAAKTGDGQVDPSEWVNVILLTAGAAAVFTAPDVPGASRTKLALALVTAGCTAAVSLVNDGISWTDAWQILAAVLAVLGISVAPYTPLAGPGEVIGQFRKP
jgi:hypothetical protein